MDGEHHCEYRQRLEQLEQQFAALEMKLAEVCNELARYKKPPKNSSNSGTPPSQDLYRKYPKRQKSEAPNGGQPGHPGHHRKMVETPDAIVPVHPEACPHCGSQDLAPLPQYKETCQEVDIPPIQPIVTEYRAHWSRCNRCHKKSKAVFPEPLNPPVQLGPRVRALTGYLKVCHYLSHQRIQHLLEDILGLSVSQGSIENHLQHLSKNLGENLQTIRQALRQSWLVGSDETRNRVQGKNEYTWVFQTPKVCLFVSIKSRAYQVIETLFGEKFPDVWVSDRYHAQLKVPCQHQLCLAHLVRNLQYAIDAEQSQWAASLQSLLRETMHFRKQQGDDYAPLESNTFRQVKQYETRLQALFTHPPPQAQSEERKLFNHLFARQAQMLYFLKDPQVPFDNNASERALRNRVVHRKVTGGFRSRAGVDAYDTIASVIETAKRQHLNILNVLTGNCKLSCQ